MKWLWLLPAVMITSASGALFAMTPGTSIAYPNIWNGGGSTWQPGFFPIPEPNPVVLLGLAGVWVSIVLARKKRSFKLATMKRLALLFFMAASLTGAFAQGKIIIGTDTITSLVTFTNDPNYVLAPDTALAGHVVPADQNQIPTHTHLVFGLYAGQAPQSLTLQTFLPLDAPGGTGYQDGAPVPLQYVLPWTGLTYMQVKVWDGVYSNYEAQISAVGATDYLGTGAPFSMTPGTSLAYVPIWHGGASTWQPGPIFVGVPSAGASPPTIIQQPTPPSLTAVIGTTARFTASATSSSPMTYQWYFGTNALADANDTALTLSNLHVAQSGSYTLTVSNMLGTATSQPATLNVLPNILGIDMVPRVSVQGDVGFNYRLEYLYPEGPTNAWQPIVTLTITNQPQYFLDFSGIGHPARFYRLVQVP